MKVPFVDLGADLEEIRADAERAVAEVVESGRFILGPAVAAFEEAFAARHGARYGIGVSSGTEALSLTFEALGIGAGDELVVPVNTFAATALAALEVGARPRLVDCREDSYLMDLDAARAAIGPRTRAIVPVHLYGRMVDLNAVGDLGVPVIEDAAQAHGAELDGRPAGSGGVAGCFSFYPSKNLGAWGDGGAVITSDDGLRDRIRSLRNWGETRKYHHELKGHNARLDTLQAAVLMVKLARLDERNRRRREVATFYDRHIDPSFPKPGLDGVFHLYVVRVAERDRVRERLAEAGIETGIHYPIPLHLQPCFEDLGHRPGEFPVAERLAPQLLSLPMYPQMSSAQQHYVVEQLHRVATPP